MGGCGDAGRLKGEGGSRAMGLHVVLGVHRAVLLRRLENVCQETSARSWSETAVRRVCEYVAGGCGAVVGRPSGLQVRTDASGKGCGAILRARRQRCVRERAWASVRLLSMPEFRDPTRGKNSTVTAREGDKKRTCVFYF